MISLNYVARIDLSSVGGRIRWAIEHKLGVTHTEFATRLGVKRQLLSRWINDADNPPSEASLQRIAATAGVTAAWLRYGGETETVASSTPMMVREPRATYGAEIEDLLDLMGVQGGLRRAFREHEPKDLVRVVYQVAIDDGWPKDKMAELDRLRERILGS
jgi:transcriptional regulator with XRE-family HTH domain